MGFNSSSNTQFELDSLTASVLNSLHSHIAILDAQGFVAAYNDEWKRYRESNEQHWSHPPLNASLLETLQPALSEGNDFALRLLLGIKEVLNEEKTNFTTQYHPDDNENAAFKVMVNTMGTEGGAVLIYEDISTQVQQYRYLRETQEKFKQHFENSLYGILVTDDEHGIIEANNIACNLVESSIDDVLSSNLSQYLPVVSSISELQKKINRDGSFLGEFELTTASGSVKPIELSVTLFRNDLGKMVASWAFEDISQKKHTRQALKISEKQYKLQFNNTLEGTLICESDGLILAANPAACKLLGYQEHELVGSNRDLIFEQDHPINNEAFRKRDETGKFTGEVLFSHQKGHHLPVEINSVTYDGEDGLRKSITSLRDISTKKMIQKQLLEEKDFTDSAISSLPNAFFVFNLDGKLIRWNNMLEQDLGYTYAEMSQMNVMEIVHPDDLDLVSFFLKGELIGKKVNLEARCITKSGQTIHYLLTGSSFEQNGEQFIVGGGLNRNDVVQIKHEKQLVDKELQRTQTFHELAVEGANIGLWELDMRTGKASLSSRWYEMLGYTKHEVEFTREFFMELLHPEDFHIPIHELERYTQERDQYEAEFRLRTKDGSYKWISTVAKFMEFDEQDNPIRISGSHIDITARKKADLENKKNQTLLNQLFDNSPIGIVRVDTDGNTQQVNQGFERIFGYTDEELVSKNLDQTITPKRMLNHGEGLTRLGFTGDSFQTETVRLNKNGEEIPVLVGGVPVEFDNKVIAIYGMYVDISERKALENKIFDLLETEKRARAQMEDMFEESPSAIAMLEGENHTFTFSNEKHKAMVGGKDVIGRTIREALPELIEQGFSDLLDECYTNDTACSYSEKEIYFQRSPDEPKKTHYLNFVYKPLHDDDNNVYGIFVEAIDVTEQVEARKIIEKSLEEKETLLNEVHHRVKNNLAIISGLLELEILDNTDRQISKHLHSTQSRISTIAEIHELLYQSDSLSHVSFKEYILNVMDDKSLHSKQCSFRSRTETEMNELVLNVNQAIPLGMLLNEILDYTDYLKTAYSDEDNCLLSLKLIDTGNGCASIELEDKSGKLLQYYNDSSVPNTTLRRDLIEALLTQIDGEISIHEEPVPVMKIHFEKRELRGPHNALK